MKKTISKKYKEKNNNNVNTNNEIPKLINPLPEQLLFKCSKCGKEFNWKESKLNMYKQHACPSCFNPIGL